MSYTGLMQFGIRSYKRAVREAAVNGYDHLAIPLMPEKVGRMEIDYMAKKLPTDMLKKQIILILSDNVWNADAPSDELMSKELERCKHLQDELYIMLPLKQRFDMRFKHYFMNIDGLLMAHVPMNAWPKNYNAEGHTIHSTWHWWHSFHKALDYCPNIRLMLEFNDTDLCHAPTRLELDRWMSEPVEAIILPYEMFETVPFFERQIKRFVLDKLWEMVLLYFIERNVNILVHAAPRTRDIDLVWYYINSLRQSHGTPSPAPSPNMEFLYDLNTDLICSWQESLAQLDSINSIKHEHYGNALKYALLDLNPMGRQIVVGVVDSINDELIDTLKMSVLSQRKHKVCIIYMHLNSNDNRSLETCLNQRDDESIIKIRLDMFLKDAMAYSDLRFDILIAQQFASIDELSQLPPNQELQLLRLLKTNGICIPQVLQVSLLPIMSMRLHNTYRKLTTTVRRAQGCEKENLTVCLQNPYMIANFPYAYVIARKSLANMDTQLNSYNSRLHFDLKFKSILDCMLNAIVAHYEVVLYKDVVLTSRLYDYNSTRISSCVPTYFLVNNPIDLSVDENVTIHFNRVSNEQKSWYEWSLAEPTFQPVHNLVGCICPTQITPM